MSAAIQAQKAEVEKISGIRRPVPLLLRFLENLPGAVHPSSMSDDPTYNGSTNTTPEQGDYSSD